MMLVVVTHAAPRCGTAHPMMGLWQKLHAYRRSVDVVNAEVSGLILTLVMGRARLHRDRGPPTHPIAMRLSWSRQHAGQSACPSRMLSVVPGHVLCRAEIAQMALDRQRQVLRHRRLPSGSTRRNEAEHALRLAVQAGGRAVNPA